MRYVLLSHDYPYAHYDLMLENGAGLATWRLNEPPTLARAVAAQRIGDHRRAYLDYEGEVLRGRGRVNRVAAGEFRVVAWQEHRVEVELEGDVSGRLVLDAGQGGEWTCSLKSGRDS